MTTTIQSTHASYAEEREWLHQYVETRSGEAFRKIVARHLDMVYSAALRQTRGDRHLADDVTQATFLVLATRAATIGPNVPLGAWLVVVTRHAAKDAIKSETRRKRREQRVAAERDVAQTQTPMKDATDSTKDTAAWESVAPELDEAIAKLADKDRRAIVLRYLQGYSIEEVATITGATPAAAKQRLHRAIDKLRSFLLRRGVTDVTAAALGPMLLRHAVISAPPGMVAGVSGAAVTLAGASASGISLAKGVVLTMAWSKAKIAAITAAGLLFVAGGTAVAVKTFHKSTASQTVVVRSGIPTSQVTRGFSDLPQGPAEIAAAGDWRAGFNAIYKLSPGEIVRFIPQPFPPERAAYVKEARLPNAPGQMLMTFIWDGAPRWHSSTLGDQTAMIPIANAVNLGPFDYVDPDKLLSKPLPGDWVFRAGATPREMLDAIAGVYATRTGHRIEFKKESVTREVIVVTGAFDPDQLPNGELQVGFWPKGAPKGAPPNHDTLGHALDFFSQLAHVQVIDHAEKTDTQIAWRGYGLEPETLDQSLASLTTQTGLHFAREKRTADAWRVSSAP